MRNSCIKSIAEGAEEAANTVEYGDTTVIIRNF
jgi:hypothetical protein